MLKIQRMSPRVGAIATGIDVRSIDERTFESYIKLGSTVVCW